MVKSAKRIPMLSEVPGFLQPHWLELPWPINAASRNCWVQVQGVANLIWIAALPYL